MRRRHLPKLAALLVLALGPRLDALAAPPTKPKRPEPKVEAPRESTPAERLEQARQLYATAETKREAGDLQGALADYRASNTRTASPQAFLGIARCLEKLGTRAEAEEAYHRFLGLSASASMVEERRLAEERLAFLDAGTLRITSDPVAVRIEVDGQPAVDTPVELRLPPGRHVVRASAQDYEQATRELELAKGGVMELAVALQRLPPPAAAPEAPPAPPPEAPTPREPSPLMAGVAFGLAAVGLGVGTAFGVRALSAKSDYDKAPSRALADKEATSAVVSDGALGAAIVCGIVGAVLVTHLPPKAPLKGAPARLSVVPLLSSTTQGAEVRYRF